MRARVLVADAHVMVAEGLGRLIADVADLAGTVSDGEQLVEVARRVGPDIIVTDITLPKISGLDAMRLLRADHLSARFIFLTIQTDARVAAEALRRGAAGYLLKQAAGEQLLDAIRAVMAGGTYLTSLITRDVLENLTNGAGPREHELTPRQRDVLCLLAQGKRMKEIALDLKLSVRTVEDHKYQLMQALHLESTAALVRFAVKQRLIPE
jgi:DNA-binding NarL/FixJ family response regulator